MITSSEMKSQFATDANAPKAPEPQVSQRMDYLQEELMGIEKHVSSLAARLEKILSEPSPREEKEGIDSEISTCPLSDNLGTKITLARRINSMIIELARRVEL